MEEVYLGRLEPGDPLHPFLSELIGVKEADFEQRRLHPEMLVVLFTERNTGGNLVGKFFGRKFPAESKPSPGYFRAKVRYEYDRLLQLRAWGFDRPPYRVVRPLALQDALEYLMVEEYVEGPKLDSFFRDVYQGGERERLHQGLIQLGSFLGRLHSRSATGDSISPREALEKMEKYLRQLEEKRLAPSEQLQRLRALSRLHPWENAPEVMVHGDATPINFVFRPHELVAIDLERAHWGDGMQDVGSVLAEISHIWRSKMPGDSCQPERDVFLQAYLNERGLPDQQHRRCFWTALYLVRICRNPWVREAQRARLLEEATQWLNTSHPKPSFLISTTP